MPVAHGSTRRLVFPWAERGRDRQAPRSGRPVAGRHTGQIQEAKAVVIVPSDCFVQNGRGNARQLTNPPVPTMISAMARLLTTEDTEILKRLDDVKSDPELMRQVNYRLDYLWFLAVVRRMPIGAGESI